MRMHILKVKPYSEAEKTFMKAMEVVKLPEGNRIECKLGAVFGKPYNEYVMTHEAFLEFKKYFEQRKTDEP